MHCSNCGASNPAGSDYCESCGSRVSQQDPTSSGGRSISQIPQQLRPMRVGDILDETIKLFRQNFRIFIGIVAVVTMPVLILNMVNYALLGNALDSMTTYTRGSQPNWGPMIAFYLANLLVAVIGGVGAILVEAALSGAIAQRYLGQQATVSSAFRAAFSRFWRLLGVTLLVGLVVILLFITILGIPFAVYLSIRWSLCIQAIVLEGTGVRQSLSRSTELVQGSWWRVCGILVLAGIMQSMVSGIPGSVIGALIGGVGALISPGSLTLFTIIAMLVAAPFSILAAPLTPIVTILLYYDLRIRKEGFDLQVLTDKLKAEETSVQGRL